MGWTNWILCTLGLLLCLASMGTPAVNLSFTPSVYAPGESFQVRCDLGTNPGNYVDVLLITIGRGDMPLAGITDEQSPDVTRQLKGRAVASGALNHTHVLETYLTMHLNWTTCADLGQFYCRMNVMTGIIVHSVDVFVNYTIDASLESQCASLTTPTPRTTTSTTTTTTTPTTTSTSRQTSLGSMPSPNSLSLVACTMTCISCLLLTC